MEIYFLDRRVDVVVEVFSREIGDEDLEIDDVDWLDVYEDWENGDED